MLIFILALAFGALVGMISALFSFISLMVTVGIVAAVVIVLTVFAMQTKYDFTGWGPYLLVALVVLTLFGFVLAFIPLTRYVETEIYHRIFCFLSALLFSLCLVYDTQLVVDGKHKTHSFSIDDYGLGAMVLYLDIIEIIPYMLSFLCCRSNRYAAAQRHFHA